VAFALAAAVDPLPAAAVVADVFAVELFDELPQAARARLHASRPATTGFL
jgi:hypothetical protein